MATRPQVLLLDEPLSNLDARLRLEARTFLKELQTELAVTTVFVTHDQAEALALADRMAVMKDGKILQVGTPREIFHDPQTRFVAGFIGSQPMNLLQASVHGSQVESSGIHLRLGPNASAPDGGPIPDGTELTIGVRPEYVGFRPASSGSGASGGEGRSPECALVTAPIVSVENLGANVLVTGRLGEERLQSIVPDHLAPEAGEEGEFSIPFDRVVLFDDATGERIQDGRR